MYVCIYIYIHTQACCFAWSADKAYTFIYIICMCMYVGIAGRAEERTAKSKSITFVTNFIRDQSTGKE